MTKKRLKSVGAILAGLVAILVLSNGTDAMLEAAGVFPPVAVQQEQGFDTTWMVVLALVYRGVYAVATWGITPAWFNVLLLVIGPPCVWLGAKLRAG